jgi:ParG
MAQVTKTVHLKVDEDTWKRFKALCAEKGVSISDYLAAYVVVADGLVNPS